MTKKKTYSANAKLLLEDAERYFTSSVYMDDELEHIAQDAQDAKEEFGGEKSISKLVNELEKSLRWIKKLRFCRQVDNEILAGFAIGIAWTKLQHEIAKKGGGRPPSGVRDFIRAAHSRDPKRRVKDIVNEGRDAYKKATGKEPGKTSSYVNKFSEIISPR